eukprot:115419_1
MAEETDNTYLVIKRTSPVDKETLANGNLFRWLELCNKCAPMIARKEMSSTIYTTVLITSIISISSVCIYFCVTSIISNMASNIMYSIMFSLAFILKTIARFITIYYYFIQFDHPYHTFTAREMGKYNQIIQATNKRLKIWSVLACIIYVMHVVRQTLEVINGKDSVTQYLLFHIDMCFTEIPTMIAQFTLTVILLHSTLHLDTIRACILTEDEIIYSEINGVYKRYYDAFMKDYRIWFVIMNVKILSIALWFWITITNYKIAFTVAPVAGISWSIWNAIIVIEYIYSSNQVTTRYHQFKHELSLIGHDDFMSPMDYCQYLYLLYSVSNNKLCVTFIKESEVSVKNAVIYVVMFAFCMLITYQILS